jgi:hypothetical protein
MRRRWGGFASGQTDEVAVTWRELEDLVAGMPASSIDHQAWRAAGSDVARKAPGVSVTFRVVWGEWVAARLGPLTGGLAEMTVEIHAGQDYVAPLEAPLARRGASLVRPLSELTLGQWSQWYDEQADDPSHGIGS